MASLTVYLGTEDRDIWLDSTLGAVGNEGILTIESEDMAVISGAGSRHFIVDRGAKGTDKDAHAIGTTVTFVAGSAEGVPALSAVLGVGNSAGTAVITDLDEPSDPQDAATKYYVDNSTGASAGTTVTGPDAFGDSAAAGTATPYSRADHDHGLPDIPAIASGTAAPGTAAPVGTLPIYVETGTAIYLWNGATWDGPWNA